MNHFCLSGLPQQVINHSKSRDQVSLIPAVALDNSETDGVFLLHLFGPQHSRGLGAFSGCAPALLSVPGMVTSTFCLVKNVRSGCQYTTCFPQSDGVKDISCLTDLQYLNALTKNCF